MKNIAVIFMLILFNVSLAFCSQMNLLVNKLVEKNLITNEEGKELIKSSEKSSLSDYIKFSGDLRLRYQKEEKDNDILERGRIRFRLKGESKVNEALFVNFRLATGSNDPRSTNQNLDQTFEPKTINLDYVYAKYVEPFSKTKIFGGKFPNEEILWNPSDLLWDSDINLEGVGLHKNFKVADINFFINSGYLLIDYLGKDGNVTMFFFQPGAEIELSGAAKLKIAGSAYSFDKSKEYTSMNSAKSNNTLDPNGRLEFNYNAFSFGTELNFENVIFPKLGFFAEGILNPDPSEKNKGFLGGAKFGAAKINKLGDWEFSAMYRELQKDAWWDVFPDSDTFSGKSDNQGIKLGLRLGLTKNTSLSLNYFNIGNVAKDNRKDLMQIDLGMKF